MTSEELDKFTTDLIDRKIFTSAHVKDVTPKLLGTIFMPVGLGALAHYPKEELANIGLLFEYLDQQTPMDIHGYPIFLSVHLLHKEDWEIVLNTLRERKDDQREEDDDG